jgi:transposase
MRASRSHALQIRTMARPFSLDLRDRVVAAAAHQTQAEVASRFAVSESTVYKWCRRWREAGTVAPKAHTGGIPPKVDPAGADVLRALLAERSDRPLRELVVLYRERTGVSLSISAVWRACNRMALRGRSPRPTRERAAHDTAHRGRPAAQRPGPLAERR